MAISLAYLDSYYLVEIVVEGPVKDDVEGLLYQLAGKSFEIYIPQIVLGETVTQILEKYKPNEIAARLEKLSNLINKFKIDVQSCLVTPHDNAFWIMTDLQSVDSKLNKTDIMILAHALADPDSKFFFTPDDKMVGNQKIIKYEKQLREELNVRNEKLKISDGF